ncbi:HAMP domain-containing sensor histidine kinase [Fredinandcohnia sp. FSL W7-1320]|uniref:HAMP domain-containing sensor histidine kinase n=1 Tax=Fredinandcohnia sp. FSL W7-1320 TaxID=2954540 RepID=UPI0030FD5326
MFNYIETLLLNLLFLVVFILFIPHIIETNVKNLSCQLKKGIQLISVIIAMISCMLFPFHIGDEIILDLRTVAIMVGGLYLGRKASVTLVVIFLIIRLYLGEFGIGFYASAIASLIILSVIFLIRNIFDRASKHRRILIACSFSFFICTFVLVIRFLLGHLHVSDYKVIITFFLVHLISTFFIVYFSEMLQESSYTNMQVIKAEKLEVVSHLASSISHEVRNPLTVVKGILQMLYKNEWDEEKRNQFIEISLQEIDRANDIIGNYLTFAKSVHEEHIIVNLEQELQRSINVITPMANMNCVDIHTMIEPIRMKGDPQLLQQCFLNITKNCIEAMPNGGNLFIRTEEMVDGVVIEIKDTGEGMSDEQLNRLGEPFFTTKGREGTGLGMMAVIKIIKLMKGKLDVTSKKNEGTLFRIYFPHP